MKYSILQIANHYHPFKLIDSHLLFPNLNQAAHYFQFKILPYFLYCLFIYYLFKFACLLFFNRKLYRLPGKFLMKYFHFKE